MTENVIDRKNIVEARYKEILERESHHDHIIIKGEDGILRWKANPLVNKLVDKLDLNLLVALFHSLEYDKNSEIYRKLYRDMGYSLEGYWEVFYWTINNPESRYYHPNEGILNIILMPIGRPKGEEKGNK